jgi:NADH dehydrogenase FAD-containing subunit
MTTHRILILGGGFGGVYAARRLDQIFAHSDDVEITLLSGENVGRRLDGESEY